MRTLTLFTFLFINVLAGGAAAQTSGTVRFTNATGTEPDGSSYNPRFSGDGSWIVYDSSATNLVAGDANGRRDIFIVNLQMFATSRVSTAADGSEANQDSSDPSCSSDGRYVAFVSRATNLVPNDNNNRDDIFIKDTQTGALVRASVASDGSEANDNSATPMISADGAWVVFRSLASNLVANDNNGVRDIFVYHRLTGTTTRVSVASDGTEANANCLMPQISGNGRYVTFESSASSLVANDNNSATDIFLHDRQTGTTSRVSTTSAGAEANGTSQHAKLAADGSFVVFQSSATNFINNDTNGTTTDIYYKNIGTGAVEIVSISSAGAQSTSQCVDPDVSADGRYVSFRATDGGLVPVDKNIYTDIFVRDRQNSELLLVSVGHQGAAGNGNSWIHALSPSGLAVACASDSSNLVTGDQNGFTDLFWFQRTADTSYHSSLVLQLKKGRIVYSQKPQSSSAVIQGTVAFGPLTPDAAFDPATDDVLFYLGGPDGPEVFTIPAGDPAWRTTKAGTHSWRSKSNAVPFIQFSITPAKEKFTLILRRFDFEFGLENPIYLQMFLGTEIGSDAPSWNKKPGKSPVFTYSHK